MIKNIFRNFNLKTRRNVTGENYSIMHGIYRHDGYNSIKHNKFERDSIIQRENEIYNKWKSMFQSYYNEWERDCFAKTVVPVEEIGEQFGNYVYFNQNAPEGYEILKRKTNNYEEVVLDLKSIPFLKDINNTNLKGMRVSPSHKYISFVVDLENNEKYCGGIYDIKEAKFYWKKFNNVSMIEFSLDGKSVYYVEDNDLNRPFRIMHHTLEWNTKTNSKSIYNDLTANDTLIFQETKDDVYIETSPTKDNNYLIINSLTKDDSQISLVNLKDEQPSVVTLFKRKKGIKHFIEHAGDAFFILSNLIVESNHNPNMKKNENYKLFTIKDDGIKDISKNLRLIAFPEDQEYFEDIDIFKDHVAVYYKNNLQPYLLIHDIKSNSDTRIKIGDTVGEITPGLNKSFNSATLKVEYSNPTTYKSLYEFNLKDKNYKLLQDSYIKGFNKRDFTISENFAPAKDGEEIPITLVHKKNLNKNRKNKTLLVGYGAYGLNLELSFDHVLLNAVQRGWVIAYAHLRGGNEKGKKWHDSGKLSNKPIVIDDYLACAYELIQSGYTHPNYLAGYGQSSGGAVVAQAINLQPELFRAAVLSHPFLDIVNTLLDDKLPLTITDYQEYGNPNSDPNTYSNMLSYSPYENISNQEYPALLISMSLDDPRVPSWGCLKYVQKLRTKAKEPTRIPNFLENNICVKIDQSGHFGPLNQNEALKCKIWEMLWLDKMLIEKDNMLL